MSATSPHGFVVVRGRGYRPEQVDGRVSDLHEERDASWERVAKLTVLAKEMAEETERLRGVVAALPPQTYDVLGARAQSLLATAEAEAHDVRSAAEAEAQEINEAAAVEARSIRQGAHDTSARLRAEAEAEAVHTVDSAGEHADALRTGARTETEKVCGDAAAALQEMSRRCTALLAEQDKEQTAESEAADQDLAAQEAAAEAREAEMDERGARLLADAKRAHAQEEEAARHRKEDAVAQGEELVAAARMREEGIERETERVLREHAERTEELRQHMAHVRASLATLTGRTPEDGPAALAPAGTGGGRAPE